MTEKDYNWFMVMESPCGQLGGKWGTPCSLEMPPMYTFSHGQEEAPRCKGCRFNGTRLNVDMMLPVQFDPDTGRVWRDPVRRAEEEAQEEALHNAWAKDNEHASARITAARDAEEIVEFFMEAVAYPGEGPGDRSVVVEDYPYRRHVFTEDRSVEGEVWHEQWAIQFDGLTDGVVPAIIAPSSVWEEIGVTRGSHRCKRGELLKTCADLAKRALLAGGAIWRDEDREPTSWEG